MKEKRSLRPLACAVALLLGICLLCSACSQETPETPGGTEIIWTDKLEPPETTEPEVNASVPVPPAKPAEKPERQPGALPSLLAPVATSAGYTVAEGGVAVSYDARETELADWSYLYVEAENYSAAYPNFKIKLNNTGAEYLSVQAVYYEMYDAGRPAVTVLAPRALRAGEQTVAVRFGDTKLTGSDYTPVSGELLKNQTILGFMIFLDSNPTAAMTDRAGNVSFTEFSLVDDDDPDLKFEETAPFISGWSSFGFSSVTIDKTPQESGSLDAKVTYSAAGDYPFVQADIQAYKADYASVKMTIKTTNVSTFSVAVAHGGTTSYSFFTGAWGLSGDKFADGVEVTFDFSALTEEGKPDSFVKDLNPYALYFYMDSGVPKDEAAIEITGIEFVRTSDSDAPEVSSFWTTNARFDITDVSAGGKATVTYDRNNQWEPILVGVTAYSPAYSVFTVRLKAYGTENIGFCVNSAMGVLKSNHDPIDLYATEIIEGQDELGAYKEYTYVIDLTEKAEGMHVAQLLIYIDASETTVVTGTRTVVFESIEFSKPA